MPTHTPPQLANSEPGLAVAVRVIFPSLAYFPVHEDVLILLNLHLILLKPVFDIVTYPVPLPDLLIFKSYFLVTVKFAVTVLSPLTLTVQEFPEEELQPLQLEKL